MHDTTHATHPKRPLPRIAELPGGAPVRAKQAPADPVSRDRVTLVVPARNEARNLPWVLQQIPEGVDEVLLIDGDSTDATSLITRRYLPAARVIPQSGPGKGSALRTGFRHATGDIIVTIDADGSMSPHEIPHYVHFLSNGYDFVKGSRFVGGGGSLDLTAVRSLGNHALTALVSRLYGYRLTDLCYGFCAFRRCFLEHLDLRSTGFEIEAEMIVRALRAGLRIGEVPSLELPRRSGRSNLNALRDGHRVLRTVLREHAGARPERAGEDA
ncbi:glycosyltransferase family 2 protein [Embleya sp. NPDC056575]|uniref:glycosyltransferase family 2 protein n=1 Tax=unclassified Embleya TaxID=2699296 RepID=UPI003679313E